ncbi:hypothetical protein [Nocardiopsis baichengensis]|uniref:hypothetical protein n=1 Tax=Nocardiopsis baichengensis TaxID=280240 RepID=UPI000349DBF8|nr:hypothetical protein [Nocardiopsis baichengensis]
MNTATDLHRLHDLIEAVRDAMAVPPPHDRGLRPAQDRIRARRAEYVCSVLEQAAPDDLGTAVRALRSAPALIPVNYRSRGPTPPTAPATARQEAHR